MQKYKTLFHKKRLQNGWVALPVLPTPPNRKEKRLANDGENMAKSEIHAQIHFELFASVCSCVRCTLCANSINSTDGGAATSNNNFGYNFEFTFIYSYSWVCTLFACICSFVRSNRFASRYWNSHRQKNKTFFPSCAQCNPVPLLVFFVLAWCTERISRQCGPSRKVYKKWKILFIPFIHKFFDRFFCSENASHSIDFPRDIVVKFSLKAFPVRCTHSIWFQSKWKWNINESQKNMGIDWVPQQIV